MKIELSHIKQGLVLEIKGDANTLFEISDEDAEKIQTVGDAINYISQRSS